MSNGLSITINLYWVFVLSTFEIPMISTNGDFSPYKCSVILVISVLTISRTLLYMLLEDNELKNTKKDKEFILDIIESVSPHEAVFF